MADGFVQVRPDSTGKKMDTEELVVGSNTVQRQRLQVVGATATSVAAVGSTKPAPTAFGLAIREVPNDLTLSAVNLSTSGDNTVIPGVGGQKIRIYKLAVWAQASNTVILKFATTAFNGAGFNFAAQQGYEFHSDNNPLVSGTGEAFVINASSTNALTGFVMYTQS